LKDEGAKPHPVALLAAFEDFFVRQPVSFDVFVASLQPAVEAVVFADV
jgi:hypothetical protein